MLTRLLVLGITGFFSCAVFASDETVGEDPMMTDQSTLIADNRRKDRRDDRQDDRDDKQDCRQEEGLVGDDKRDCKQENRGEGDEDEGAEADGGAEAEDGAESEDDSDA
jgi:hypothetical protein